MYGGCLGSRKGGYDLSWGAKGMPQGEDGKLSLNILPL